MFLIRLLFTSLTVQTKHIKMLGTRSCLHLDIIRKLAHCVQKVADPWYSVMGNGGFYVPCILFGIGSDNRDLGVLVSRPLTNFKKATDELKANAEKASHLDAVTSADLFLKVMSGKQPPVHQQTSIALANRVAANKKRLVFIVKTILLCGRQTFALKGHDDSTKTTEAQPTSNPENFKALLQFLELMLVART